MVELGHVLVHVRVVVTDVPLRAAIGHRAKAEGWGIIVRPLELEREKQEGQERREEGRKRGEKEERGRERREEGRGEERKDEERRENRRGAREERGEEGRGE